ncbi:19694_t:CDS:2, partial [Gigaspora margarita]
MQRKGGKPLHQLTEYFYIIPNKWANKSNRKCICRACMEAVGRDFALKNESMKITNTLCYCANHIKECPYFAPDKVIAMSQVCAEVLRTYKKKSNLLYTSTVSLSSVDPVSVASSTYEEDDTDDNITEDISSEADWNAEQDNLDVEIDFLDSETHPAKNPSAKWELQILFLPNLPFP